MDQFKTGDSVRLRSKARGTFVRMTISEVGLTKNFPNEQPHYRCDWYIDGAWNEGVFTEDRLECCPEAFKETSE
jgi:uncharacterized protein YodC (DUF2158 family)